MRAPVWLAAALIGAGLAFVFYRYPVLAASEEQVSGLQRLPPESVLDRLGLEGRNILSIDLDGAAATLRQDPWVRDVHFQRQLPNRVVLSVEERIPAAVWHAGARFFLIDLDGTILEELSGPGSLPVVKDLDGSMPQPGDHRDPDAVALAVRLTELLPQEMGESAQSFEYLRYGGLVVETDKGKRARFGDASDVLWKLAIWKAVLKEAGVQHLKAGHVDLRFGDRPFFRP